MKAVFWWCHAHSGDARTAKEKLATMPRDSDIDLLYDVYSASRKHDDGGRNGAIGPFGKSSTAKTHSRFGSIDNREHMFRRDTHFVL